MGLVALVPRRLRLQVMLLTLMCPLRRSTGRQLGRLPAPFALVLLTARAIHMIPAPVAQVFLCKMTLAFVDRGAIMDTRHPDPMLLEPAVPPQSLAAPCREFDPMIAEADVMGRVSPVCPGRGWAGSSLPAEFPHGCLAV
jgi:hypothetical protein